MGFDLKIEVDASGPVFDGSWEDIMTMYRLRVETELSNRGVRIIREYLPTQYMYLGHNGGDPVNNPVPPNAGYLVSQIHWEIATANSTIVTDGGYPAMIYGPWIEGIGPGNMYFGMKGRMERGISPRFPGYHAFARATTILNIEKVSLAEEFLPPYLAALNGE